MTMEVALVSMVTRAEGTQGNPGVKHDTVHEDLELLRRVRSGEPSAREAFLVRVTDVVRVRVGRVLARASRNRAQADLRRRDLLDLMQDVFVVLLDRDAKVLAAWEPERGLSLDGFVGLVAERETLAFLRSGRRSAWAEHPSEDIVDEGVEDVSPELQASAKEELSLLLDYLSDRLSPQGALLFQALYVDHASLEDVCERFSMSPGAVYSFRTRLKRLLACFRAQALQSYDAPSAPPANLSSGGVD
ncbi:MAG TPA: hypothetical protein VFQ35_02835 [Polyangiaceae bacterium]|nr:hypothetical protein [Polyangiaceae bacterium]